MEEIYGEVGIEVPKHLYIPEISNEALERLYKHLKPIVDVEGIKYFMKEYALSELKNLSYIWEREEKKTEVVDKSRLETVDDFLCLHTWGYYGLFKPSIYEILAQMPADIAVDANCFEIIESPVTRADVFRYQRVIDGGFHLSKVRGYHYKK